MGRKEEENNWWWDNTSQCLRVKDDGGQWNVRLEHNSIRSMHGHLTFCMKFFFSSSSGVAAMAASDILMREEDRGNGLLLLRRPIPGKERPMVSVPCLFTWEGPKREEAEGARNAEARRPCGPMATRAATVMATRFIRIILRFVVFDGDNIRVVWGSTNSNGVSLL